MRFLIPIDPNCTICAVRVRNGVKSTSPQHRRSIPNGDHLKATSTSDQASTILGSARRTRKPVLPPPVSFRRRHLGRWQPATGLLCNSRARIRSSLVWQLACPRRSSSGNSPRQQRQEKPAKASRGCEITETSSLAFRRLSLRRWFVGRRSQ